MRRKFEKFLAKRLGLIFEDNDPVWCEAREVLWTGGIRSGKSTRLAFRVLCKIMDPSARLIWLVGPDYQQARQEFRYVLDWCLLLGLATAKSYSMPMDGPCTLVTLTGCRVETKSAQHTERLASVAPDLAALCEPGQMPSEVYDTVLGRLLEKRGTLLMGGTLEADLNKPHWIWYEDLAREWALNPEGSRERSFSIPTWSNKAIFPLGLADPEIQVIKSKISQYDWDRKYAGIPTGVSNPVFKLLHEEGGSEFLREPELHLEWVGGAIGVDYGCVPLNTEMLTREGFKPYDELVVGEEVAVFDPTTDRLAWGPLQAKTYYPTAPLVRIEQKGFHFTCTPDHAWAVSTSTFPVKKWLRGPHSSRQFPTAPVRQVEVRRKPLNELSKWAEILVAAPLDASDALDCSPAEAAVLGWLVTDGWMQGAWWEGKFSAILCQKNHVDEVLRDLDESGLPYSEQKVDKNGVRRWRLTSGPTRELFSRIGYRGKETLVSLVLRMSSAQRERMLDAMMLAEGHGRIFTQNEGPVLEAFEIAQTLQGNRLNQERVHVGAWTTDKVCKRVSVSSVKHAHPRKVIPDGYGPVWCPTTNTGFWVARQSGQITITGNTTWEHPSAIVVVTVDNYQRLWVREAWKGYRVGTEEIRSMVEVFKDYYDIQDGCVDPNQAVLADILGFAVALGGASGGKPTEMRFNLANELLENRGLYFDLNGPNVREVLASMKIMGRTAGVGGRLRYARPLDDDLGQALMYAIEFLRTDQTANQQPIDVVPFVLKESYATEWPSKENKGRA